MNTYVYDKTTGDTYRIASRPNTGDVVYLHRDNEDGYLTFKTPDDLKKHDLIEFELDDACPGCDFEWFNIRQEEPGYFVVRCAICGTVIEQLSKL